jgi:ATP-dependent DNA helicase RecQ
MLEGEPLAPTPSSPSSGVGTPALEAALRDLFGHAHFREGQREIVETVLAGKDALAVLPTGAGKSLLYQLPAFLLPGVTIAVSPLIALMKDQLDKLAARGLPAAVLSSAQSPELQERTLERLVRGETKLLLVAPERFRSQRFRTAIGRVRVSRFAVDEAHCVSEWGHDFRPEYDRLGEAARAVGRPPILAVTATATERVRRDIARSLELEADHRVFIRGFDRPNLRFSVVPASGDAEKAQAVARAIRESGTAGSVLVYCATRKSCERVAEKLRGERVPGPVVVYHAGLASEERRSVQERWQRSEARVCVATNAFGLGIDKEDVRLVCHHDLPGSLEAYYQEAGRAGRDGRDAACVLVFSGADVHLQQYLAEGSFPDRACVEAVARELARARKGADAPALWNRIAHERQRHASDRSGSSSRRWSERAVGASLRLLEGAGLARSDFEDTYEPAASDLAEGDLRGIDWDRLERLREHEREKLARVLGYARGTGCRRASILRYFDALANEGTRCGACDRCQAPVGDRLPADEALTVARKVLSLVARLKARFGRGVVARLLAGEVEEEDKRRGIAAIPTVGALRPWSSAACASAVDACLAHELLETYTEDGMYPKLRLTPLGVSVVLGRSELEVAIPRPLAPAAEPVRSGRRTRPARKEAAEESGPLDEAGERLLVGLRRWRAEQAREARMPAYCVFHDRTLAAIAAARPRDLAALLLVPGVGTKKAERYGEALLELVAPPAASGSS